MHARIVMYTMFFRITYYIAVDAKPSGKHKSVDISMILATNASLLVRRRFGRFGRERGYVALNRR